MSPSAGGTRGLALDILARWERGGGFIDALLHAALERSAALAPRDRRFVQELVYGVIRNLRALDFLVDALVGRPPDQRTRCLLRLGLYQLVFMRVAEHAAVNECVELAGRARSLVNAVLRRFLRERGARLAALDAAPEALRRSHPDFLVERWRCAFGAAATSALLVYDNAPPPLTIRVNELVAEAAAAIDAAASGATPVDGYPEMRRVDELPGEWLARGYCYMQDPSTLHACRLLAPLPGERVLDACAAPGGKTALLAAMMRNTGTIVAADSDPHRLGQLGANLSRLAVDNAEFTLVDWLRYRQSSKLARETLESEPFDRILVDVPCSNTGVLRRRVDARWRLAPGDFTRMPRIQRAIVEAVLPMLKPGGALVYSTCSLECEENDALVASLRDGHPGLAHLDSLTLTPFEHGHDGAFAALFERRE